MIYLSFHARSKTSNNKFLWQICYLLIYCAVVLFFFSRRQCAIVNFDTVEKIQMSNWLKIKTIFSKKVQCNLCQFWTKHIWRSTNFNRVQDNCNDISFIWCKVHWKNVHKTVSFRQHNKIKIWIRFNYNFCNKNTQRHFTEYFQNVMHIP